jgi:hypothetical protein
VLEVSSGWGDPYLLDGRKLRHLPSPVAAEGTLYRGDREQKFLSLETAVRI